MVWTKSSRASLLPKAVTADGTHPMTNELAGHGLAGPTRRNAEAADASNPFGASKKTSNSRGRRPDIDQLDSKPDDRP